MSFDPSGLFYSNQSYVYGLRTLKELSSLKVFIYGLRGVGIETAKNLILTGTKQVVIQDNEMVQLKDLGTNCFCTEEDVGHKTRAQACLGQLRSLNSDVDISVNEAEITIEFLERFNVVVFTDFYDKKKLIEFNNFCRNRDKPIGFIYAGSLGLYGFVFVDFGPKFTVIDATREKRKAQAISEISNENPAKVVTLEHRHGFEDGDYVKLEGVDGMTEVNEQVYRIKVISPYEFNIECDTTNFGKYIRYGFAKKAKKIVPEILSFNSFEECLHKKLNDQEPVIFDDKKRNPRHLHNGLKAILQFYQIHQTLPKLNNEKDVEEVISLYSEEIDKDKVEVEDDEVIRNISRFGQAQISPVAALIGGITAIEVTKYLGTFMPLRQWLHYDIFALLPETEVNRNITGSRYDDQIAIFGREFQKQLMNKKLFLVGVGGLGCHFIKQFALTGLSCGPEGKLTCTDDDIIEISNLSTSSLFRKKDIGKIKSQTACEAGKKINKNININPLNVRVNGEADKIFNDGFWDDIDIAVSAVNNIMARTFLDSKCVFYHKHLLESGTLGIKGHTQVVIPFETQSYEDSRDPGEDVIPLDTLVNFPYQPDHVIAWARDYFEEKFVRTPEEYQSYREDPFKYIEKFGGNPSQHYKPIQRLEKFYQNFAHPRHEGCIKAAREFFQEVFHNRIIELTQAIPADRRNENGKLYWSMFKRYPKPLIYDPKDEVHSLFIFSAANLFAHMFNLSPFEDQKIVAELAANVKLEAFKAPPVRELSQENFNEFMRIRDEENARVVQSQMIHLKYQRSYNLPKIDNIIGYRKDNPCQIDFISATAILRARNYGIPEPSRRKIRAKLGNLNPTIAAMESIISSAIVIEIFKLVAEKGVHISRNTYFNLANPMLVSSEPMPAIRNNDKEYDPILMGPVKAVPPGWTNWDRIGVKGPMTIGKIMEHVQEKYGVNTVLMASDQQLIYFSQNTDKNVLGLTLEEWYQLKKGDKFPDYKQFFEVSVSGEIIGETTDVSMPNIRYIRNL